MESHGLAAHAVAPLAVCELVTRLCLVPAVTPDSGNHESSTPEANTTAAKTVAAKGGKGKSAAAAKSLGADVVLEEGGDGASTRKQDAGDTCPALALVCLKRSRLLFKLGPS